MNQIAIYEGTKIDFEVGGDETYVNATQMCKANGKLWGDYWRNQTAQDHANTLSSNMGITIKELVYSKRGNRRQGGGTWVHRLVAQDLARWCSPEFAVWVSIQIDEFMRTGKLIQHPEHQEAELTAIAPAIYETLGELKSQRIMFRQTVLACKESNLACKESNDRHIDTLKALQKSTPRRVEKVVRDHTVRIEGGMPEIQLAPGHIIDIVIPGKWAIEVKHWKEYKKAVGQIELYDIFMTGDEEKRIHLFWKPLDKIPTQKKQGEIERECRRKGIAVTWHDWEEANACEIQKPKNRQRLLKF